MDISTLTSAVSSVITPVLPMLVNALEQGAADAAKQAASKSFDALVALWKRLAPKVAVDDTSRSIVDQLAKSPEDADYEAAFKLILRRALESDPELARDVSSMIQSIKNTDLTNDEHVNANICVKGSVNRSNIVVGRSVRIRR